MSASPPPLGGSSMFFDQCTDSRNEGRGHGHSRVGVRLERGLILSYGFLARMRLVMLHDALDARLVPARWKLFLAHVFLRRRLRSARLADGVSSNAVITNAEPGSGSGT